MNTRHSTAARGEQTPGLLGTTPASANPLRAAIDRFDDRWTPADSSLQMSLDLARDLGSAGALPGHGDTLALWEALATVAAIDLGVVRVVEPHLDALAILDQAGFPAIDPTNTWGVFAAEGGPAPVSASSDSAGWHLTGVKPWCSLAGTVDRALVSSATTSGERRLFSVDLRDTGIESDRASWVARGLSEIPSGPVSFDAVPALPIGDAGWYLSRPGFAWGGIGVAACWYGGAVALARSLFADIARKSAGNRDGADRLALMHLGAIDAVLHACRAALVDAASRVDAGEAEGIAGSLLAKRVRAIIARSCEEIIVRVGHAMGPAPLALDAEHAKRVADLQLYVRQHHAERDDASLGDALARQETVPW